MIGVIVAIDEEMNAIKEKMKDIEEQKIYNLHFYKGKINDKRYVVVKSGVGKANAARTTQILVDRFEIDCIINFGTAGGINYNLQIGDVVIGETLLQHDFDTSTFGDEKFYITGAGKYFFSDKELITKAEDILEKLDEDFNVIIGTIATGDVFVSDPEHKIKILTECKADCVEMEGAAIAQVCNLDNIPCIVIRGISDVPNGSNNIEFEKYAEMASKRCVKILEKF